MKETGTKSQKNGPAQTVPFFVPGVGLSFTLSIILLFIVIPLSSCTNSKVVKGKMTSPEELSFRSTFNTEEFAKLIATEIFEKDSTTYKKYQKDLAFADDHNQLRKNVVLFLRHSTILPSGWGQVETTWRRLNSGSKERVTIGSCQSQGWNENGVCVADVSGIISHSGTTRKEGFPFHIRCFIVLSKLKDGKVFPQVSKIEDRTFWDNAVSEPFIAGTFNDLPLSIAIQQMDRLVNCVNLELKQIAANNAFIAAMLSEDPDIKEAVKTNDRSRFAMLAGVKLREADSRGTARLADLEGATVSSMSTDEAQDSPGADGGIRSLLKKLHRDKMSNEIKMPDKLSVILKKADIPAGVCRIGGSIAPSLTSVATFKSEPSECSLIIQQPLDDQLATRMTLYGAVMNRSPLVKRSISIQIQSTRSNKRAAKNASTPFERLLKAFVDKNLESIQSGKAIAMCSSDQFFQSESLLDSDSIPVATIIASLPLAPSEAFWVEQTNRNRFLDMAVSRFEQLEHLESQKSSQQFARRQDIDSLAAPDSTRSRLNTFTHQKSIPQLYEVLEETKAKFGSSHPFTLEAELALAIAYESMHASSRPLAYKSSLSWLTTCDQLARASKSAYLNSKRDAELPTVFREKIFSKLSSKSAAELRRWMNDSGAILALLLWGHGEQELAVKVCNALVNLSMQDYPTEDAVGRILFSARLLMAENEYAQAHLCLTAAQKLAMSISSGDGENRLQAVARCKLEEARLSCLELDFGKAAESAMSALADLNRAGDLKSLSADAIRADVFEQLARALATRPGKIAEAIDFQTKCVQLRRRRFGENGSVAVMAQLDLAKLLTRKARSFTGESSAAKQIRADDLAKAKRLLNKVIIACKKYQQTNVEVLRQDRNLSMILPRAYFELGVAGCIAGQFGEARESFENARAIDFSSAEPNQVLSQVADLDALANIDMKEGNLENARKMISRSSKLLDEYAIAAISQLSLAQQIAFSKNLKSHMDILLAACNGDDCKEAYSELVKWKGFLIEQFKARADVLREEKLAALSKIIKMHGDVSRRLMILNQQDAGDPVVQEQEVKKLQDEKEKLERQINLATAEKIDRLAHKSLSSDSVRNALQDEEVLIDFYEFAPELWSNETEYAAFICSPGKVSMLKLGPSRVIDKQIGLWRTWEGLNDLLPAAGVANSEPPADPVQNSFAELKRLLSGPLRNAIPKQCAKVWACDEGQLSRLPWSLMLSSSTGEPGYEVSQVDSPRELLNLKSQRPTATKTEQILLVGGIDYSRHVPPAPALEHAAKEIDQIRKEAEPHKLNVLVLSEKLGSAFKAPTHANVLSEMSRSRFAHLVTHGFFRQSEYNEDETPASGSSDVSVLSSDFGSRNPLSDSGLLVSYNGKTADHGFLTAETILDTDLSLCRMITLSACETGRGQEVNTQGVIGLRSALMGAGAKTLLLSLWPVPDRATSTLMSAYYEQIFKGEAPVLALRKAQAEVRKHEEWEPPYFWASWIIVGDGWMKK